MDNIDGIVLDHTVVVGNPADAPMLVPAIARIVARFGKVPRAVTADRGYGEAAIGAGLEALGVEKVVIPRKGKPNAARREEQGRRGFRTLMKWRTGSEARISSLKRDHGWRRSLMDGIDGAETWCAWGVLANNATKISGLVAAKPAPATPERAAEVTTHPGRFTTGATASARRLTVFAPRFARHAPTAPERAESEVGSRGEGRERARWATSAPSQGRTAAVPADFFRGK